MSGTTFGGGRGGGALPGPWRSAPDLVGKDSRSGWFALNTSEAVWSSPFFCTTRTRTSSNRSFAHGKMLWCYAMLVLIHIPHYARNQAWTGTPKRRPEAYCR